MKDRMSQRSGYGCCTRDSGMDVTITPGMNEQGQAYTYGGKPQKSQQNGVESELYEPDEAYP